MVLQNSTISTQKTEDSSSGASLSGFTPLWNPKKQRKSSAQTSTRPWEEFFRDPLISNHTSDAAQSPLQKEVVIAPERGVEAVVFQLLGTGIDEDDDLLIDERIETKPKAVYKAKIRIHGYHRAKPSLPIGDDLDVNLLDE